MITSVFFQGMTFAMAATWGGSDHDYGNHHLLKRIPTTTHEI